MADTITIWPGEREGLIDDLDDRVENRNQAILDAINIYLAVRDVIGDDPLWEEADDRTRRTMMRQALIDYQREHLDE